MYSLHICLVRPLARLIWVPVVEAALSPPRQCTCSELEGLTAGAWLSIPVSLLLNIYSEMYQMLPRKDFVSFQVPKMQLQKRLAAIEGIMSVQCPEFGSDALTSCRSCSEQCCALISHSRMRVEESTPLLMTRDS